MGEGFATPWLRPGARVALVAPASSFDRGGFERGVARLRGRYDVRYDEGIFARAGYLAGGDERRLRELQAAIDDPLVDGIIAARGGYGVTRLLSKLALRGLQKKPKLLCGFSDITALHAAWARARVASVHGMMVATLGDASDDAAQRLFAALEGRGPASLEQLEVLTVGRDRRHARVSGLLLGGNLAVLTALVGTPYFPAFSNTGSNTDAGAILFLEDVNERPYRIDRMLTTLLSAGVLAAVSGIVLGAFEKADPGSDAITAREVLLERLGELGVPVLAGVPAGHIDDNLELPFGTEVTLDVERGSLIFHARQGERS